MTERTKTLTMSVQETAEELGVRISRAGLAEWVRANEQKRVEV